jgi:hypothetical protein
VDFFSEGDEIWWTPDNKSSAEEVIGLPQLPVGGALDRAERSLVKLEETRKNGVFSPIVLGAFHKEFSTMHIASLGISNHQVRSLYNRIFERLEAQGVHFDQRLSEVDPKIQTSG